MQIKVIVKYIKHIIYKNKKTMEIIKMTHTEKQPKNETNDIQEKLLCPKSGYVQHTSPTLNSKMFAALSF